MAQLLLVAVLGVAMASPWPWNDWDEGNVYRGSRCDAARQHMDKLARGCETAAACEAVGALVPDYRAHCRDTSHPRFDLVEKSVAWAERRAAERRPLTEGAIEAAWQAIATEHPAPCAPDMEPQYAPPTGDPGLDLPEIGELIALHRFDEARDRCTAVAKTLAAFEGLPGPDQLEAQERHAQLCPQRGCLGGAISKAEDACFATGLDQLKGMDRSPAALALAVRTWADSRDACVANRWGRFSSVRAGLGRATPPADAPIQTSAARAKAFRRALMETRFGDAHGLVRDQIYFDGGTVWRLEEGSSLGGFYLKSAAELTDLLQQRTAEAQACAGLPGGSVAQLEARVACVRRAAGRMRAVDKNEFGEAGRVVGAYLGQQAEAGASGDAALAKTLRDAARDQAAAERAAQYNSLEARTARLQGLICGLRAQVEGVEQEERRIYEAGARAGWVDRPRLYRLARLLQPLQDRLGAAEGEHLENLGGPFEGPCPD